MMHPRYRKTQWMTGVAKSMNQVISARETRTETIATLDFYLNFIAV